MILLFSLLALAQEPDPLDYTFQPELFRPHTDVYGYGVTHGSSTLSHLQVGIGMWGNHADDSLVLLAPDGRRYYLGEEDTPADVDDGVLDRRNTTDFQLGFGLFDRLSLTVNVPVVLWQAGYELGASFDSARERDLVGAGPGDASVLLKGVLVDLDDQPVGIALLAEVTVPTGRTVSFLGEGEPTVTPMAVVELSDGSVRSREHHVRLAINAGYRFRTPARYQDVVVGNTFLYRAALGLAPSPNVEVGGEAVGALGGEGPADRPLEVLPYLKLTPAPLFSITAGAGFGILPGLGAPDWRIFLGGTLQPSFNPRDLDRDKDGIQNNEDACPNVPEDFDGFQDEDGCPEDDNDRDSIPDVSDRCPNDPEDFDGFEDEDGCPEDDNDNDGLLDVADRCPNEPETVNGYQDDDGCPDRKPVSDRDGDGYRDEVDGCPDDPEDFDGIDDTDGCPEEDPDRDGDGISDRDDACPDEPETFNGYEDDDGCPDEVPPQRVRVERTHIVIDDRIYFDFDKASIKPVSFPLLDEIATVILDHPELERIRIEGHTSSEGDEAYNLDLSQRRAESVMRALVDAGVAAERLEAVGYGESTPIADNAEEEGRQQNRRVEFLILERED